MTRVAGRAALAALLVAGGVLRVLVAVPPEIDGDEAWVGIGALSVLRGVFLPFFYGQPYMGGLESFLDAPLVLLLGTARSTLKVLPVAAGVLFVALTWVLAAWLFDRTTAAMAALLAAFPPWPLLKWATSGRLHYSLAPLLGTLLLLAAVRVMARSREPGGTRWLVLGLLSGLVFWHNYIGIVYLAAAWGLLAVTHPRQTLLCGARWALPGFVTGSLPMWVYNAQTGRLFVSPRGTWAPWEEFLPNLLWFVTKGLPSLLGAPERPGPAAAGLALLVTGAWLGGLVATAVRAVRGEPRAALAPLVVLAMTGLVTASVYGARVPDRYIFPLLAVVPLVFAAGLGVLGRWGRWPRALGFGLAGVLAAANAGASLGAHSAVVHPEALREHRAAEAAERELLDTLRAMGLRRAYSEDYGALNYTSGDPSLVFSRIKKEDPAPAFASAVDAAADVAYVSQGRSARLEPGLEALGVRYRVERLSRWWVYHGFELPRVRYEEILPAGWTATASERSGYAADAFDRDLETVWKSGGGQRPGAAFVLDLGRVEAVGMVAWTPMSFQGGPRGIEAATSVDGRVWQPAVRVDPYPTPVYWSGTHPFLRQRRARVELRFEPRPARLVRLTQLGADDTYAWSIRELFVYRPAGDGPAPRVLAVEAVARHLRERAVTRVYGDHWVLSRLRVVGGEGLRVLPVGIYIDNHGRTDLYRRWRHPPEYDIPDRMRFTRAAVVLDGWTGGHAALEELLRASGLGFRRQAVGDYLVYSDFVTSPLPASPLSAAGWRASASAAPEDAPLAVDGDRGTRWTVGAEEPGGAPRWFAVDLGAAREVDAVLLDLGGSRREYPRRLRVAVSLDGARWEPVPAEVEVRGSLYWAGTHALRGGAERIVLRFPARPARLLRLEEPAPEPVRRWSLHELQVFGPAANRR